MFIWRDPGRHNAWLNVTGEIVQSAWLGLRSRFPGIELNEFVVMPNHFHAIVASVGAALVAAHPLVAQSGDCINSRAGTSPAPTAAQPDLPVGATLVVAHDGVAAQNDSTPDSRAGTSPAPTKPPGLGDVIGAFKYISTHEIILAVRCGDRPSFAGKIWQRNYYERIIRDEREWERFAQYIGANPTQWAEDVENPRR